MGAIMASLSLFGAWQIIRRALAEGNVEHALSPRAAAARRNSARSRRKPEQFSRSDCTPPQGIIEECIWTFHAEMGDESGMTACTMLCHRS